jgi:hypothetical protein
MFRAHRAHHQERQIVSMQPLVTVICDQQIYNPKSTFGWTLDRRCHFKHVSLKQSQSYHCQTNTAHR